METTKLKTIAIVQNKIKKLREDKARAQGSLDEIMKKLKAEFGCESIEQAEELLKEYSRKQSKIESLLSSRLKKFEEKWGDILK